jgi:pantothenate kinase
MPHFDETASLGDTAETLYQRLIDLKSKYAEVNNTRRMLVAVAGIPVSGKSVLTSAVARLYEERQGQTLTILPMVLPN